MTVGLVLNMEPGWKVDIDNEEADPTKSFGWPPSRKCLPQNMSQSCQPAGMEKWTNSSTGNLIWNYSRLKGMSKVIYQVLAVCVG